MWDKCNFALAWRRRERRTSCGTRKIARKGSMDKKVDASGKHPPLEQFFALIFASLGIWTHDVLLHVKGEGKETSFPTYGSHWPPVDVTIALSPLPCTSLRLAVQLLYSQPHAGGADVLELAVDFSLMHSTSWVSRGRKLFTFSFTSCSTSTLYGGLIRTDF